jgi:hypothetical protein
LEKALFPIINGSVDVLLTTGAQLARTDRKNRGKSQRGITDKKILET